MKTNLEMQLFKESIKLWGINSQILMLAEESSELSVACLHLLRESKEQNESFHNFAEEIADVEFLIAEMKDYFSNLEKQVNKIRIEKSNRLSLKIELELGKREAETKP